MVCTGMSLELWTSNLVSCADDIADAEHQRLRWLAVDAQAWERPAELLCALLDDCNLEFFIQDQGPELSDEQLQTAMSLYKGAMSYDVGPTGWRDPQEVLNDPQWDELRTKARQFSAALRK